MHFVKMSENKDTLNILVIHITISVYKLKYSGVQLWKSGEVGKELLEEW